VHRALDIALALWVAAWVGMGVAVAGELRNLTELSGTIVQTGSAVEQVGATLETLSGLPLVGDELRGPAREIREAGASAVNSGRSSAASVRDASTLLGIAIAVIPTAPLLALWLPLRVRWERDRRALRAAANRAGDDPAFEVWLARRALERLPYKTLTDLVAEPWHGATRTQARELADAELRRHGVERGRH